MATAYWNGANSTDLSDPLNWWDDTGFSVPFSGNSGAGYPGSADDLDIRGTMPASNSGSITNIASWTSSNAATGTTISGCTAALVVSGNVTVGVSGDATSLHTFEGSVAGTLTCYGGSTFSPAGSQTTGAATFNNASIFAPQAGITVNCGGNYAFNNTSTLDIAAAGCLVNFSILTMASGTTLNGGSGQMGVNTATLTSVTVTNSPTINSSVVSTTCNGSTQWNGNIANSGAATIFSGTAAHVGGTISGGSVTFNSGADLNGGTINTDAAVTFNSGSTWDSGSVTTTGNVAMHSATIGVSASIAGAVDVDIDATDWAGDLTCSGDVTLENAGTIASGTISVGGTLSCGAGSSVSSSATLSVTTAVDFPDNNVTLGALSSYTGGLSATTVSGGGPILSRAFTGF